MKYVSLILSEDAAHECVHNLGELSALQFTDLNPEQTAFQRRYVNYVKRCDELERKLRFILKEIEAFGLQISWVHCSFCSQLNLRSTSHTYEMETTTSKTTASRSSALLLDTLEAELEEYETQLLELNTYSNELTHKYNEKVEFQECLEKGRKFLAA